MSKERHTLMGQKGVTYQLYGQFLLLKKVEEEFVDWFKTTRDTNSDQVCNCMLSLPERMVDQYFH